jgi:hypothetical protein
MNKYIQLFTTRRGVYQKIWSSGTPMWESQIKCMIYLLNAIGLPPGGSSTVHIYTQTVHKTQNKQYIEQHKNFGRVRVIYLKYVSMI